MEDELPNQDPPDLPKKDHFTISLGERTIGFRKVDELIANDNHDTESPQVKIVGNTIDNPGTDKSRESSIQRYEQIWRGLRDFCFLMGDYQSAMILCREQCPADPPAVALGTAVKYLRFRYLEKGETVKDPFTDEVVKDRHGNVLKSRGDWNASSSSGLLRSALSKVHSHYDSTKGEYMEECVACKKIPLEDICKGHGCAKHPGLPHHRRRGCVTKHKKFKDEVAKAMEYCEIHYEARSTYAFLPEQLRDIREYCLSQNTHFMLMMWTMVIVGVKLFLRIDEVITMKVEDFKQQHFVVTADNVEGLCVEIFGKKERKAKPFYVWDDKDCPEFDAAKAILLWLAVSGIESGYMFPTPDHLKAKSKDPSDHFPYKSMLTMMKKFVFDILGEDKDDPLMMSRIVGTHMLRKTAFLIASWGLTQAGRFHKAGDQRKLLDIDQAALLLSARHDCVTTMMNYLSDSPTMKALIERIDPLHPKHMVGRWNPIHMRTLHQHATLSQRCQKYRKEIVELANWFCFEIAGVPRERTPNIRSTYQMVLRYTPDTSIKEKLVETLDQAITDPATKAFVLSLIQKDKEETFKIAMHQGPSPATEDSEKGGRKAGKSVSKKRRRVSEDASMSLTRDFQSECKSLQNNRPKYCELLVQAVSEAREQARAGKQPGDDRLKSWLYRAGKVSECISTCHSGQVDAFLESNRGPLSKFSKCSNGINHSVSFDPNKM